jgi:hypothetical protein
MIRLFVGSTGDHAGQSLVAWALARRLKERGIRVGFFKPVAAVPAVGEAPDDEDALLFQEVLDLDSPAATLSPRIPPEIPWRQKGPREILEALGPSLEAVSRGKDVVIIIGSRAVFVDEPSHPLSDIALIHALEAVCVLVHRYKDTATLLYSILSICSLLRERVRGILISRVPPERTVEVGRQVVPFLLQKGLPRAVVVPEDPLLASRSLREVAELVGAEVLTPGETMERPVGGMSTGTPALEGALAIFKRVYNKIVLLEPETSGDPQGALPAKGRVAGILITGGRRPADVVVEAARESGLPLLRAQGDTFTVLDLLEKTPSVLSARDHAKVGRLTEILDAGGALDALIDSLGPLRG